MRTHKKRSTERKIYETGIFAESKSRGLGADQDIIDAIMAENGRDIEAAKQAGSTWEEKYNQAVAAHQQQLQQLQFESALEAAVRQAGGRNTKAIAALLDTDEIRQAADLSGALKTALEEVKKENDYLFSSQTPPLFARGTGTQTGDNHTKSATLAGALREKYERK